MLCASNLQVSETDELTLLRWNEEAILSHSLTIRQWVEVELKVSFFNWYGTLTESNKDESFI